MQSLSADQGGLLFLAQVIDGEVDLAVCAQCEDSQQAMLGLREHKPDVVLVDLSLKGTNGIELIKKLKAEHPNLPGHYIEFIELYADHTYLARLDFTPQMCCPIMKVCLSLDHVHKKLRAYERCNLHGVWEGDLDIEVT